MYTASGCSVQGGANLARRSRQALDDSDVIGLAQEARQAADAEVQRLLTRAPNGPRSYVSGAGGSVSGSGSSSIRGGLPRGTSPLDQVVKDRLYAPRYNPASRYFDPPPLASAYLPPPLPAPLPPAMKSIPGLSIRTERELADEHRASHVRDIHVREELRAAAGRAESTEADLATARAAFVPSAHSHAALHPLPMPPPPPPADWELHETAERLAALGEAQRCVARQQAGAVDLLESENVRLVQMKNNTDLERDRLKIEAIQLGNALADQENLTRKSMREAQIEGDAKDRLSQRLLSELHETQTALKASRLDTKHAIENHQACEARLVSLRADHDTEISCNKALTEKLSTLNERNMKLDQQLGSEKELKAKARRSLNTLVEIAATLKGFLKNANQHARDCKARGYFASRSQKVHDNFLEILDRLIELAGSLDKEQTRKQVMGRISKVEDSWAQ